MNKKPTPELQMNNSQTHLVDQVVTIKTQIKEYASKNFRRNRLKAGASVFPCTVVHSALNHSKPSLETLDTN